VIGSTAASSRGNHREAVCALCGASLRGRRPQARFCGPPCRIESSRLRAILNGNYAGPYRSVVERLQAAQKAYKGTLVTNAGGPLAPENHSVPTSAVSRLLKR
jgi:hypothetical protein